MMSFSNGKMYRIDKMYIVGRKSVLKLNQYFLFDKSR